MNKIYGHGGHSLKLLIINGVHYHIQPTRVEWDGAELVVVDADGMKCYPRKSIIPFVEYYDFCEAQEKIQQIKDQEWRSIRSKHTLKMQYTS